MSYARQVEKCSAYLTAVGIHGSSHETFRLFQIFQSVPKGTAGAAEIPGCRAAIYQLLCTHGQQHTGLLKNLSLYTFRDRVSVTTPAALLVHRRSDETVFAPIQTFRDVAMILQSRYYRFDRQSASSAWYQFHLREIGKRRCCRNDFSLVRFIL